MRTKKKACFSDEQGAQNAGWVNPKTGEVAGRVYIKGLTETQTGDSEKLKVLLFTFQSRIEEAEKAALAALRESINEFSQSGYLTKDEVTIIDKAMDGDVKACQALVQANPATIAFPFVAKSMIELALQIKYIPVKTDGKRDGSRISDDPEENRHIIDQLKLAWCDYLSLRSGGKIYHSKRAIHNLVERLTKKDRTDKVSKTSAYEEVANEIGCAPSTVKSAYREIEKNDKKDK